MGDRPVKALQTLVQRAFSAGEMAPGLGGRADLVQYQQGLSTCRNFLVKRQGGVANRPGTAYVATAKDSATSVHIRPFYFPAADESYLIEVGEEFFRFHHNGEPVTVSGVAAWSNVTAYVVGDLVVSGGTNYYCILAHTNHIPPNGTYWYALTGSVYEIPTPYAVNDFHGTNRVGWKQSGSVITLTHLDYPPMELVYGGSGTAWTLRTIATAPATATPTGLDVTQGTPGPGPRVRAYVITAIDATTLEESLPCAPFICTGCPVDPTVDDPNVATWDAGTNILEHRVYCDPFENGTFGYIGTATDQDVFSDTGLAPDFLVTPPIARVLFDAPLAYPGVSVTYQQRRIFGGTHTDREKVYASRTGYPNNFGIHSPIQDDDAVTWKTSSDRLQPIVHMVGLKPLVILTDQGEWTAKGDETGVITPTAQGLEQHSYVGAAFVPPVLIGNILVFLQARATVLRELLWNQDVQGLTGRDLTTLSTHLFEGHTIDAIDYAHIPDSIVWCVRDDGALLGLTYQRDQEVLAWHRHDTYHGEFEDVCVLPEADEDAVYVVVARQVNGSTVRYIERLHTRFFDDLEDAFLLDCGITKDGASSTSVTGLGHLANETVYALADGVKRGPFTVSGGAITLPVAAELVHVGLRITAELETLRLDVAGASLREKRKRVQAVTLLVNKSASGFSLGPDEDHLFIHRRERWDTATSSTGAMEMNLTDRFGSEGQVFLRHTDPTPLEILSIIPSFEVGG